MPLAMGSANYAGPLGETGLKAMLQRARMEEGKVAGFSELTDTAGET